MMTNKAVMAFQRGEHRLSANLYKEAFQMAPGKWSQYRYHILHGLVSILKEKYFAASQEDFQFLEKLFKDKKEPHLYRIQAAKSLGLLHWDQGRREEAAEYYRDTIALGKKATEKERRKTTYTNVEEGTSVRMGDRLVGEVMDEVVKQASDNLAVLETTSLNRSVPPSPTAGMRSDGTRMPDKGRRSYFGVGLPAETLGEMLAVGGTKCDCCGKTREEMGVTHLEVCSRCKKAYYCSAACQKEQWKAGHKQACRQPGQVEAGDFVRLHGLQAKPELNGMIVKVIRKDPNNDSRWEVLISVGEKRIVSIAQDKMEQLRPLK